MDKRVSGDKVRFAIVGLGGMGQGHLVRMQDIEEIELAAVCDNHQPTAEKVGRDYRVPSFTDPGKMFESSGCDAVLVATPHPVRLPIILAAVENGVHILSEKPLSECVSTAEKMIVAASKANLAYGVMFQRRAAPACAKAIEIARQGLIGKVHRTLMICPEYRSQAYYDSGGWRATWIGEGGGVMINQAPHLMDLFVMVGGMPTSVLGRTETRLHNVDVEDVAEALLQYQGGGTGYLYATTCEGKPGEMIEVAGDKGKLVYRDGKLSFYCYEQSLAEFTTANKEMWKRPGLNKKRLRFPKCESGHGAIIRNFARHLLYGEELIAPAEEGFRSLELANAIWLSAHQGRPIKLPIDRDAYDAFLDGKRREHPELRQVKEYKRVTDDGGRGTTERSGNTPI